MQASYSLHLEGIKGKLATFLLMESIWSGLYLFGQIVMPVLLVSSATERLRRGLEKSIERFFGVIQTHLRVLRIENQSWGMEKVMLTTKLCYIPHNYLMEMSQYAEFEEAISDIKPT